MAAIIINFVMNKEFFIMCNIDTLLYCKSSKNYKRWMMKIFLSLLILSTSVCAQASLAYVQKSVILTKPLEEVFEYVKDTTHDKCWRREVNSMTANAPFGIGTFYVEDAHIGLNRNFITTTQITDLKDNDFVLYETPADAKYYLSSHRKVQKISESKTKFTYTIQFDPKMSKETLGLYIPARILSASYGILVRSYMRKLKSCISQ